LEAKIIGPDAETAKSAVRRESVMPILGMSEEEFVKLARKILVMIPHRRSEGINAGLAQAIGFWSRFGTATATVEDDFGGFVEMHRAGMVRTFLDYAGDRTEIEYCVLIDSDESVPWDAPYRLAAWDQPVVSGVICSYSEARGIFACFTVKDEYNVARFPSWNITKKMPGRGLIEAHSVGTGLLCIKKHVFETIIASGDTPFVIPEEQRRHCIETGVMKWGEDISFSRQCEARGFKRYVDLSVRGIHMKTIAIQWPSSHIDHDVDPREWKVDTKDYLHGQG
jgi:hypothetical protein